MEDFSKTACKAVICQSLRLQKQLTSLATSNRAEAEPAIEPCHGSSTMPPRGLLGQRLRKGLGQSISAEDLPQFLPKADSDSPAAWHSPHVSHVIQLPKREPCPSCLWILGSSRWSRLAVTSQWFQRKEDLCKLVQAGSDLWMVNQLTRSLSEDQCFSNVCCKLKIPFLDDSFSTLKNVCGWENRAEAILFFSSCHYCSSSKLQHGIEMKHLQDASS